MSMRERVHRYDRPTWTKPIILGTLVWVFAVLALGQLPSVIIYKIDQYIAQTLTSWLFIAFIAIAVGLGVYLSSLSRRQHDLERRLKDLEPHS